MLAKIRSPFCVNLHYSYQDDTCVYLTLSLMPGGDLTFLLKSRHTDAKGKKCDFRPLGDDAVKFYAASMACGLQAIHDAGYVYRDMKPQNVLLDGEGQERTSDTPFHGLRSPWLTVAHRGSPRLRSPFVLPGAYLRYGADRRYYQGGHQAVLGYSWLLVARNDQKGSVQGPARLVVAR